MLRQARRLISTSPALDKVACSVPRKSAKPVSWHYIPSQVPYALGLLLQETLVHNRLEAKELLANPKKDTSDAELETAKRRAETDVLLLLQHKPVYTAGRRERDPEIAATEAARLGALGADYVSTMRGGQTTYHGPGQLVGYSIMDLQAADLTTRCYVHHLETFLENLTKKMGVDVHPIEHTGVFVSPTSKIGSIGIHIRKRVSLHGFAINVEDQVLPWFGNIVACGLNDVTATSAQSELSKKKGGERVGLKVEDILDDAVSLFGQQYGRDMERVREDSAVYETITQGLAGKLPPLPEFALQRPSK